MNAAASPTIAPPPADAAPLIHVVEPSLGVSPELVAAQALRLLEAWTVRRADDQGGPAEADEIAIGVAVDTVVATHRAAREALRR